MVKEPEFDKKKPNSGPKIPSSGPVPGGQTISYYVRFTNTELSGGPVPVAATD